MLRQGIPHHNEPLSRREFLALVRADKRAREDGWHSLGTYQFNAGEEAAVIFRTENAGGNVHLDAVQVLPGK